jgi:hypothetical protein
VNDRKIIKEKVGECCEGEIYKFMDGPLAPIMLIKGRGSFGDSV